MNVCVLYIEQRDVNPLLHEKFMARQKRNPCPETEALSEKLGQTIQRLRTADKMSLGDLSNESGVAKSMISQIEKNETNPTLATLSRLSQALGTSVEAMVSDAPTQTALVQHTKIQDTPLLTSEDGLCEVKPCANNCLRYVSAHELPIAQKFGHKSQFRRRPPRQPCT